VVFISRQNPSSSSELSTSSGSLSELIEIQWGDGEQSRRLGGEVLTGEASSAGLFLE
jgi:hypothetical protein